MPSTSLRVGSIVTGRRNGTIPYSVTNQYTVMRVTNTISFAVEVIGYFESAPASVRRCLGRTYGVAQQYFELYDPLVHGPIAGGEVPTILPAGTPVPGLYSQPVAHVAVTITDHKLRTCGVHFDVAETYTETGYTRLTRKEGSRNPVTVQTKKLRILDAMPSVGDLAVRLSFLRGGDVTGGTVLRVLSIEDGVATVEFAAGMPLITQHQVPLKELEIFNTQNVYQSKFFGSTSNYSAIITELQDAVAPEPDVEVEIEAPASPVEPELRKFWMIAGHTDEDSYPATSETGPYAPRQKIYDYETARDVLSEMRSRHGAVFYLLEAVEGIHLDGTREDI